MSINNNEVDFQAIEDALWAVVKGATSTFSFAQSGVTTQIYGNLADLQQPALFQIPLGGNVGMDPQGAQKYMLRFLLLVYCRRNQGEAGQKYLFQILKAVDKAFKANGPGFPIILRPAPDQQCWAWIEGEVTLNPGILDEQCSLEIPVMVSTGM